MNETPSDFPADGALVSEFPVSQLKCHRLAIFTNPYQEILLVRKEPTTRRFARDLLGISDLSEHF
jgi:hypothetical protein